MRDVNPTVVLIPGIGMFSFGKSKTEARITGEFYVNAIHVMEGATLASQNPDSAQTAALPQAGAAAKTEAFTTPANYVALPLSEAFRIEYWRLEEAKLRRQCKLRLTSADGGAGAAGNGGKEPCQNQQPADRVLVALGRRRLFKRCLRLSG